MEKLTGQKSATGTKTQIPRRTFAGLAAILAVLFMCTMFTPRHDTIDGVEFDLGDIDSVQASGDQLEYVKNQFSLTDDDLSGATIIWTESTGVQLEQGSYTITVEYTGTSDWNMFLIYSPSEMDENGSTPAVYASVSLPQDQNTVTATVTLDRETVDVRFVAIYPLNEISVQSITVAPAKSDADGIWWFLFLGTLVTIAYCLLFVRYRAPEDKKERMIVLCLVGTIFYLCLPMMNGYLYSGDDIAFHLTRIEGLYEALRDGQFPMWINYRAHETYGYISPIMYPQLFLLIPALLRLAGMSLLGAAKQFFFMMNIAAVLVSYFSFKLIFRSRRISLVSTLSYCLGIYYLINFYLRSAVGESLAMIFVPLLAAVLYEVFLRDDRKWYLLVFAITGIMESHLLSTYLYAFLGVVTGLVLLPRILKDHPVRRLLSICKAAVWSVLLNVFFLVPFLHCYQYNFFVNSPMTDAAVDTFQQNALYLNQMYNSHTRQDSPNLTLGSISGEMSLTVGFVSLLVLIALALLVIFRWKSWEERSLLSLRRLAVYSLVMSAVLTIMTLWVFPWQAFKNIPILKMLLTMQYPWRLLGPLSLCISLATGCLAGYLFASCSLLHGSIRVGNGMVRVQRIARNACTVLLAVLIFANSDYFMQQKIFGNSYSGRWEVSTLIYADGIYFYKLSDPNKEGSYLNPSSTIAERGNTVISSVEGTVIQNFSKVQGTMRFDYQLPEDVDSAVLAIPYYYYEGYTATVDGEPAVISGDDYSLAAVAVTQNSGTVVVTFEVPWFYNASYVISALGAAAWILYLILYHRHRKALQAKKEETAAEGTKLLEKSI